MEEQRDYLYFDAMCEDPYNRRLIDGNITGRGKCVAYCKFQGHSGFLDEELRRQHDCENKSCSHYFPKPKRVRSNKPSKQQKTHNIISEVLAGYEGIKATKIAPDKNGGFLIKFVSLTNAYSIPEIEDRLFQRVDVPVKMQKVECDFDRAVKIIFGLEL